MFRGEINVSGILGILSVVLHTNWAIPTTGWLIDEFVDFLDYKAGNPKDNMFEDNTPWAACFYPYTEGYGLCELLYTDDL